MKKLISLTLIGALLSGISLAQARSIVFDNKSGQEIVVRPKSGSYICSTQYFTIDKGKSHTFDVDPDCYSLLATLDFTVSGNTHVKPIILGKELSSNPLGTSHVTIQQANNTLTATVTN